MGRLATLSTELSTRGHNRYGKEKLKRYMLDSKYASQYARLGVVSRTDHFTYEKTMFLPELVRNRRNVNVLRALLTFTGIRGKAIGDCIIWISFSIFSRRPERAHGAFRKIRMGRRSKLIRYTSAMRRSSDVVWYDLSAKASLGGKDF